MIKGKKTSLEGIKEIAGLFTLSEVLFTAIETKLFDTLDTKGKTAEEIHAGFKSGGNADALERLLLILAGAGIIKLKGRKYKLYVHTAPYLQSFSDLYIGDILLLRKAESAVWKKLPEVLQEKKTCSLPLSQDEAEQTLLFQKGMRAKNIGLEKRVAKKIRIESQQQPEESSPRLLELCIGPASFSASLLSLHPSLEITGLDLPQVLPLSQKMFQESIATKNKEQQEDFSRRITFVEGDLLSEEKKEAFLHDHAEGFDAVFIADAVHIWNESTLRLLFAFVNKLLRRGGIFSIYDYILNENHKSPLAALQFNMTMQLLTDNGKVYTKSELRSLLHDAGFGAIGSEPVAGAQHLLLHARKQ